MPSATKESDDLKPKSLSVLSEFGDLSFEDARIRFVEAVYIDHVFPAGDSLLATTQGSIHLLKCAHLEVLA